MTMTRTAALFAALSLPAAVQAQSSGFSPCDGRELEQLYIGEDGEGVRTFYDGSVVLLRIDTIEPAAASGGMVVMMWTGSELSDINRSCWVNTGHGLVDVDATESSYDPAEGLTLSVPTSRHSPEDGSLLEGAIRFRLNADAGTLTPLS